jgi:hypothetical protein
MYDWTIYGRGDCSDQCALTSDTPIFEGLLGVSSSVKTLIKVFTHRLLLGEKGGWCVCVPGPILVSQRIGALCCVKLCLEREIFLSHPQYWLLTCICLLGLPKLFSSFQCQMIPAMLRSYAHISTTKHE